MVKIKHQVYLEVIKRKINNSELKLLIQINNNKILYLEIKVVEVFLDSLQLKMNKNKNSNHSSHFFFLTVLVHKIANKNLNRYHYLEVKIISNNKLAYSIFNLKIHKQIFSLRTSSKILIKLRINKIK